MQCKACTSALMKSAYYILLALPSKMRACGFGTLQQPLQVDQGGGKEGKGS